MKNATHLPVEMKQVPAQTETDNVSVFTANRAGESTQEPPTRAEFQSLAEQVKRLAAQIAHGRA